MDMYMLFITTTRYRINKLPNEICFYGHFKSTEKIEVPVLIQRFPTCFLHHPLLMWLILNYPQANNNLLLKFTSVTSIGEVQKKRSTRLLESCFVKISVKSKKTCLQAYNFDNGVTLPTEESHITPRG